MVRGGGVNITSLLHPSITEWIAIAAGLATLTISLIFKAWQTGEAERAKITDLQTRMRSRLAADGEAQSGPMAQLENKVFAPILETRPGIGLETWIEQAHSRLRASQVLLILLLVPIALTGAGFLLRTPVSGLLVGVVVDVAWVLWLRARAAAAMRKFADQLPEVFQALANAQRAGQSLAQSISFVSRQLSDPAAAEFRKVSDDLNRGAMFAHALQSLLQRRYSTDLEIGVSAILIQRELGGNLASVLDNLANMIRVRRRVEAEVRLATAQVRSTVYIVGGLVPVLALIMNIESPGYLAPLITPGIGFLLLIVAVVGDIIGVIWTWYLARVTV